MNNITFKVIVVWKLLYANKGQNRIKNKVIWMQDYYVGNIGVYGKIFLRYLDFAHGGVQNPDYRCIVSNTW